MVKTRDDIVREELEKTIYESASIKLRQGNVLQQHHDLDEAANFLRRYDWVWCFWPEPRNQSRIGASIVRDVKKEKGGMRCQSIVAFDRETAAKLYELCRGPDNHAPAFPPEPAGSSGVG
jgi:hypothetical protein